MTKAQFTALKVPHDDYEKGKLTERTAEVYKWMVSNYYAIHISRIGKQGAYRITSTGYLKFMEERTKREPSRCPNTIELEVTTA